MGIENHCSEAFEEHSPKEFMTMEILHIIVTFVLSKMVAST